ncbi:ferrochelatase [Roseibium salinum]|nr:ferrochelatase [Roseibium salinum]
MPPYHDDPVYVEALAKSVERHLAGLDFDPEVVLTSYHGIPQSYFRKGDPYHCHCMKTTRLLRKVLGWDEKQIAGDVPVPFRTGRMAAALHRQDRGKSSPGTG